MSSRPAPGSSDASAVLDDFEWPPRNDNVSVHEIDADPWLAIDGDERVDEPAVIFEPDAPGPAAPPPPAPRRRS